MVRRSILRNMCARFHKIHIHLQRCIRQCSQKLKLCFFLERHQIQNTDLQRSDFLTDCSSFVHDEYIFIFQYSLGGEVALYFNWHFLPSSVFVFASQSPDFLGTHYSIAHLRGFDNSYSIRIASSSVMIGTESSFAFLFFPDVEVISLLIR